VTGMRIEISAPPPADMARVLDRFDAREVGQHRPER
jgi:hypothetical protein